MMHQTELDFWSFHGENPKIYEYFIRFALEAKQAGHKRSSQWLIMNRVRWETYLVTTHEDFKVSNDSIAYYARLAMYQEPELLGFFQIKQMKHPVADPVLKAVEQLVWM